MVKAKNLPNLGKQTQKVIGKMVRENKQVQKRAISKDYNPRKDTTLYSMKYDMKKREELYITNLNFPLAKVGLYLENSIV